MSSAAHQRFGRLMLRLIVVVGLLSLVACSDEGKLRKVLPKEELADEWPRDDLTEINDEDVLEQIVVESVILLTGEYLSDENVRTIAAEIFAHPQVITQLKKLLDMTELEGVDRASLIYIAGISGQSEFSEPLFKIASAPRLNPETVDEMTYEIQELDRVSAISALGRLGDAERLEALLEVIEPHTQITVWLELHKLDGKQWPMRKLIVESDDTLLSDPKYREFFNMMTNDLNMDGITVLDDEGSECEELEEWWPEDELWLALAECEGEEECDELWELAIECDHPCVNGCDSNSEQVLKINENPYESSIRNDYTAIASAASENDSSSKAPSCPNYQPWLNASISELGKLEPIDAFEALSANLPKLWAAVLTAIVAQVNIAAEWCDNDLIGYYKDQYNFDNTWDRKMGENQPCDLDTALGRTLNAIHLLHTATPREPLPWLSTQEDLLAEGGTYTREHIPKLIASCSGSAYMSTKAKIRAKKRHVTVRPAGFYLQHTVERASTLVHEARHAQRCRHNGNDGKNKCVSKSDSCDESYFDGCKKRVKSPPGKPPGANGYQVRWLVEYLKYAEGEKVITDTSIKRAVRAANFRLNQRFDVDPGFNVDEQGVLYTCDKFMREKNRLICLR